MPVAIQLPRDLYQRVLADLRRPHAHAAERIGFLYGRFVPDDPPLVVMTRYVPVPDEPYVVDETLGGRINGDAIRDAVQGVLDNGDGVFHTHLPEWPGTPWVSRTDDEELPRLIPAFRAVGPTRATGLFLLSSDTAVGAAAGAIAREYAAGVKNTAVLAGANEDQKSYACNRLRHGIFTFWLCRALEGAAADEEGRVRLSALNSYTHERTKSYTDVEWGKTQTPVQFGKVEGDPVLLTLRPELPETLCRRMAAHLDLDIRRKRLKHVAVVEFLQPIAKGEGLGGGNLAGYTGARVREALAELAGKDYGVWDERQTAERLAKFPVGGFGAAKALRALAEEKPGLDAVVTGLLLPNGSEVQATSRLYTTADGRLAEPFKGRLPLSEDLLGDLGGSLDNAKRPKGDPHDAKVVAFAQQSAEAASPLLAKGFAFPLEVWGRKPGAKEWAKKEWVKVPDGDREGLVFGVTKGEELRVRVWNKTGNDVACQLSVDGLNTISQARDRVGAGPAWVLSPAVNDATPSLTCEGWYFPKAEAKIGEIQQARMNRFVVVDAAASVAGRQRFGEKIGTITAAFYLEAGRQVGVGEGASEQRPLKTVNFKPGRLAAVVQLRYVDETELNK